MSITRQYGNICQLTFWSVRTGADLKESIFTKNSVPSNHREVKKLDKFNTSHLPKESNRTSVYTLDATFG